MKKWQLILLAIALCGCLILGMTACAKGGIEDNDGESQSQQDSGNTDSDNSDNGDNGDNGDLPTVDETPDGDENESKPAAEKDNITNGGVNSEGGWGPVTPIH